MQPSLSQHYLCIVIIVVRNEVLGLARSHGANLVRRTSKRDLESTLTGKLLEPLKLLELLLISCVLFLKRVE